MKVLKFGGSSVGNPKNVKRIIQIVNNVEVPFVVVVSALSGVTDLLKDLKDAALKGEYQEAIDNLRQRHISYIDALLSEKYRDTAFQKTAPIFNLLEKISSGVSVLEECSDKSLAKIMSCGEKLSSTILEVVFKQEGIETSLLDTEKLIKTHSDFLTSIVDSEITEQNLAKHIDKKQCYIAPGFISSNEQNEITLLGRGGSDYTATLIGNAVNAESVELWSDVSGMMNANPKLVDKASPIKQMSYAEAFEMAYFGAKVLYPKAIRPAMKKNIPVWLKNTQANKDVGTLVGSSTDTTSNKILGVTTLDKVAIITLTGIGLQGTKGSARRFFQSLEEAEVNVILITQSCSEQSICIAVNEQDSKKAYEAILDEFSLELKQNLISGIDVSKNHSILALVGDQMKRKTGIASNIFDVLSENHINITAIAQGASERNISVVVDTKDEHKAVNAVHERFFQESNKKINAFVIGIGNVGQEFLDIFEQQKQQCLERFGLELNLVGFANSKNYILDPDGLENHSKDFLITNGTTYNDINTLTDKLIASNLRNCIVIDNTASPIVSKQYKKLLNQSISITTCNKIASSSAFEEYTTLKQIANDNNCHFLYETTVGAALPVIKTIRDLVLGGDQIRSIEAVLSGSLNFIFNNYDTSRPFYEVVKQAQEEGYTEPDPRLDLGGTDVMRKILILSREAGYCFNIEDVSFNSFLPKGALETETVDEFYTCLKDNEDHFRKLYDAANKQGHRLKIMAKMKDGRLEVAAQSIAPENPFFNLAGKDNLVSIQTDLYNPEPLIVKGAGAGPRLTASGVFMDLIYIANQK